MDINDCPETIVFDKHINSERVLTALKQSITLQTAIQNCRTNLENIGKLLKENYSLKIQQVRTFLIEIYSHDLTGAKSSKQNQRFKDVEAKNSETGFKKKHRPTT